MREALIIGDDQEASKIVETRLTAAGYSQIARAETIGEARRAAATRPQLVVILAEAAPLVDVPTLYEISETAGAPILVATSNPARATECLGPGAALDGPFDL